MDDYAATLDLLHAAGVRPTRGALCGLAVERDDFTVYLVGPADVASELPHHGPGWVVVVDQTDQGNPTGRQGVAGGLDQVVAIAAYLRAAGSANYLEARSTALMDSDNDTPPTYHGIVRARCLLCDRESTSRTELELWNDAGGDCPKCGARASQWWMADGTVSIVIEKPSDVFVDDGSKHYHFDITKRGDQ